MRRNYKSERQAGSVLFELVLIIPFLVFLCLGVVEFVRALRHYKIAQTISKEMANVAYRECSDPDYASERGCLVQLNAEIEAFAQSIIPNTQVLVSLHEWNGAAWVQEEIEGDGDQILPGFNADSRIGAGSWPSVTLYDNLNPDAPPNQVVVVAEVFVPYNPYLLFISQEFGFVRSPDRHKGTFYDSTIL